jgi:hypothetical protein
MNYPNIAGQEMLDKVPSSKGLVTAASLGLGSAITAAADSAAPTLTDTGPLGWAVTAKKPSGSLEKAATKKAKSAKFPSYDPQLYIKVGDGTAAVNEVRYKVNDSFWDDWATRFTRTADDAGHKCGPGSNSNSLDQETVDKLEKYTNANDHTGVTDQLVYFSVKFFKNVVDDKQAFGTEFNRVATEIAKVNADKEYIDRVQPGIVAQYKAIKEDLSVRIDVLQKILQDAKSNNNMLKTYQDGSNIDNNKNLNEVFDSYLTERIGVTKGISVQNYEDLYSSIILQNDILQNTQSEMKSDLLKNNKKAIYVNEDKNTMYIAYIRATIVFYILLIIYFLFLIIYDKNWTFYIKLLVISGLGIFPTVAPHIEMFIYNIWNFILSIMSGSIFEYKTVL